MSQKFCVAVCKSMYLTMAAAAVIGLSAPVIASPITLMLERNTGSPDNRIAFRSYASNSDLLTNTQSAPQVFSPLDLSLAFNSTGLTWDGSQYIMMFARSIDSNINELQFRTYASRTDLLGDVPSAPNSVSRINVAGDFNTTGLTWDGSQFVLMSERSSTTAANRIRFQTYATFSDLLNNVPSSANVFSPIQPGANKSTGLDWDGSQYVMMFETNFDRDFLEVQFRTYANFTDLLGDIPSGNNAFTRFNVPVNFDTNGLATEWESFPAQVPTPASLLLVTIGLASLRLTTRVKRSG